MSMNIPLRIFNGITDTAVEKYFEHNTLSIKRVQAYADNTCDVFLDDSKASKLLKVIKQWRELCDHGWEWDLYRNWAEGALSGNDEQFNSFMKYRH